MRLTLLIIAFAILSSATVYSQQAEPEKKWPGVDEVVVGKFAAEAGRPARTPYINTDQGDLLLFVFLGAGFLSGFTMGYFYKELFTVDKVKKKALRKNEV